MLIFEDFVLKITNNSLLLHRFLFCNTLLVLQCQQWIVQSRVALVHLEKLLLVLVANDAARLKGEVAMVSLHLRKYAVLEPSLINLIIILFLLISLLLLFNCLLYFLLCLMILLHSPVVIYVLKPEERKTFR